MGPPRTRRAISANPSRFQEGSMNDRVSAAPPVHFLGPKELAELECPVERSQSRPSSDDFSEKGVKKGRLLGRVWDGVRGRLGFREENEDEKGSRRRGRSRKGDGDDNRRERSRVRSWSRGRNRSRGRQRERDESAKGAKDEKMHEPTPKETPKNEMPTREEILANYHHLVASGFFTSHAIQSTRQPPPGNIPSKDQANNAFGTPRFPPRSSTPQPPPTARAITPSNRPRSSAARSPPGPKQRSSREEPQASSYDELVATGFFMSPTPRFLRRPSPPARAVPTPPTQPARSSCDFLQPPTPRWASRGGTPSTSRAESPIPSPTSVSSRGTKRAADPTSDDEVGQEIDLDPPTPKKKLRKNAPRDIAAPKVRNSNARRGTNLRRSVSGPNNTGREHNNLARRVLGVLPGVNARSSVDVPGRTKEAVRRCASGASSKAPLQDLHTRVLRSRKSLVEALRPGQNSNRAPPRPPVSTSKFVSCQDGENGVPYLTLHF